MSELDKYILDVPKSFSQIVEVFNEHEIYDSKFVEELNVITEIANYFFNELSPVQIINCERLDLIYPIFMHIDFTSFEKITPREIFISIIKMVEHFLDVKKPLKEVINEEANKIITEFKKD